jgi:hypothetical protein
VSVLVLLLGTLGVLEVWWLDNCFECKMNGRFLGSENLCKDRCLTARAFSWIILLFTESVRKYFIWRNRMNRIKYDIRVCTLCVVQELGSVNYLVGRVKGRAKDGQLRIKL